MPRAVFELLVDAKVKMVDVRFQVEVVSVLK